MSWRSIAIWTVSQIKGNANGSPSHRVQGSDMTVMVHSVKDAVKDTEKELFMDIEDSLSVCCSENIVTLRQRETNGDEHGSQ